MNFGLDYAGRQSVSDAMPDPFGLAPVPGGASCPPTNRRRTMTHRNTSKRPADGGQAAPPSPRRSPRTAPTTAPGGAATTKTARLIGVLRAPGGADLAALGTITGWQAHTIRAALSRLRKAGYQIERSPGANGGGACYKITSEPVSTPAIDASGAASS